MKRAGSIICLFAAVFVCGGGCFLLLFTGVQRNFSCLQ